MRISLLALSALLTSCSSPEQEPIQEEITTSPTTEMETVSGPASMIANAKSHLDDLAEYMQSTGGDIKRVFNEINNQSVPPENAMSLNFVQEITSEGGLFTCITDSKISVDTDPNNLGKSIQKFNNGSQSKFVNALIAQLRKMPTSEIITTYATLPTKQKDPKNPKVNLGQKHLVVAYGRLALLGEELDKNHHQKFFCYVAYPLNH